MALVPAQSTQAVLQRKVLNYCMLTADTDNGVVALEAINDSIDEINTHNWRKFIKQDDTALVADTRTYTLPTDFRAPRRMVLWDSSDNPTGRLSYLELQSFLNEYDTATQSGSPCIYTTDEQARKVIFNVAPDAAFVAQYPKFNLWYHYRQVHLAGVGEAITLPTEFEGFVLWNARAILASFRRPDALSYAAGKANDRWRALVANDNDTMTDWE